jgi:hypothetical protein
MANYKGHRFKGRFVKAGLFFIIKEFIMNNPRYRFFTSKELKPSGWLKEQLKIQAQGLCGNLDKVWPDVKDSKWIGGDREGWERVPYWLDGFIPMAWLLEDEELKKRAKIYIDAILKGQEEDGWICPCSFNERPHYDVWAVFLICKVLVVYHDCSGDDRVPLAVYRALYYLHRHMRGYTLFDWGAARWYECLIPLRMLYEQKPEKWMMDLAIQLKVQGTDWESLFKEWPYQKPEKQGLWNFLTHVVNLSMCLKSEALYSSFIGKESNDFARLALNTLLRDHGMPIGHFTGDECLAGRSPVQGTELCGIVEAMYSYEWLFAISGDNYWADCLESLAFNGLPATISADMWSHQYDQMTNQVQCTKIEKSHFMTNDGEAHLFGLEPHYGCCTANFGQGWPKLALSGLLAGKDEIAIGAIVPCKLDTSIRGVPVSIELITRYPFEDSYRVIVTAAEPVDFTLSLRFPDSARAVKVNGKNIGKNPGCHRITQSYRGKTEINVEMDFIPVLVPHGDGLYYVQRGNLIFALPIKSRWEKREFVRNDVERKFPYCDYELFPESRWNYGFSGSKLSFRKIDASGPFFDPARASMKIKARIVPIQWNLENGTTTPLPEDIKPTGPEEELELLPYGCTDLRMTAMPLIKLLNN